MCNQKSIYHCNLFQSKIFKFSHLSLIKMEKSIKKTRFKVKKNIMMQVPTPEEEENDVKTIPFQ